MKIIGIDSGIKELKKESPEIIKIDAQFEVVPTSLIVIAEAINSDTLFRVKFNNVEGFRVLNEADQLIFWDNDYLPNDWIWRIESGGWIDTEKKQNSTSMLNIPSRDYVEYFITGITMCVNVACSDSEVPIIEQIDQN